MTIRAETSANVPIRMNQFGYARRPAKYSRWRRPKWKPNLATQRGDAERHELPVSKVAAVLGHNFPNSQWYKDAYTLVSSDGSEPVENQGSWISNAFRSINPF